jgi:hypothetical protein
MVLDWHSDPIMKNARDSIPKITSNDDVISSSDAGHPRDLISDCYLYQAVGTCCTDNGRLVLSKDVRDLIARFAPADRPTMNAISQELRRPFLNELATITGRSLPPDQPIRAEPTFAAQDAKPFVNGHEPTRAESTALASQDARLIANGYEPIAVNGKVPVAKGWNTRPSTTEAIAAERGDHPRATSTGLRTGRLVGVDIDIIPAEHVQAIRRLEGTIASGGTSIVKVRPEAMSRISCQRSPLELL